MLIWTFYLLSLLKAMSICHVARGAVIFAATWNAVLDIQPCYLKNLKSCRREIHIMVHSSLYRHFLFLWLCIRLQQKFRRPTWSYEWRRMAIYKFAICILIWENFGNFSSDTLPNKSLIHYPSYIYQEHVV
jgi:hypothetical protein